MAGQLFLTEQHIHTKDKTHGHGKNAVRHAGCNVKQGPHKIGGDVYKRQGSSGSSSSNSGNPMGSDGVVVAVGTGAATAQPRVISDTTIDFTVKSGSAYCFKMTVVNGNNLMPSFTVGNGNVLKLSLIHISQSSDTAQIVFSYSHLSYTYLLYRILLR